MVSRIHPGHRPASAVWPAARFLDLDCDSYDTRTGPERKKRNPIRQLGALGYKVTLEPAA